MNSKLTAILIAVVLFAPWTLKAESSTSKQDPQPPSDPVMESLRHGVNHIDTTSQPGAPSLERRDPRYQIGDSDVLDLKFTFTPDFDQTVTVQPDGFITLREVGDIQIRGDTLPQVTQKLERAYASILAKPVITVYLQDFEKPYFLALGEVGRPGKYDMRGDVTLSEAVAMAGGFNSSAKHSQVLLFHRLNNQWASVTKFNLKKMLKSSASVHEDPELAPGDMVYIPKNALAKIKPFIPTTSMGTYGTAPIP